MTISQHVAAFNSGDRDTFTALLAPDAVLAFHASNRVCRGANAITDAFWNTPAVPGTATWDVVNVFGSDGLVTLEYVRSYRTRKTGGQVSVPECAIYSVRDSKITAIRHYSDRMTELAQLGAMGIDPPPDQPQVETRVVSQRAPQPAGGNGRRRVVLRRHRPPALSS